MEDLEQFKSIINNRLAQVEYRLKETAIVKFHNDHENAIESLKGKVERITKEFSFFQQHAIALQDEFDRNLKEMKHEVKAINEIKTENQILTKSFNRISKKFKKIEEGFSQSALPKEDPKNNDWILVSDRVPEIAYNYEVTLIDSAKPYQRIIVQSYWNKNAEINYPSDFLHWRLPKLPNENYGASYYEKGYHVIAWRNLPHAYVGEI